MIDRTVLKNDINNYFDRIIECANDDSDNEFATILSGLKDSVIRIIRNQQSVNSEQKHGHWILTSDEEYEYCKCSECGFDTGENWMIGSEIPYCQNCGSKNYNYNKDNNECSN